MVENSEISSSCQEARHEFARLMQEQLKNQNLNSAKIAQITRINTEFVEALLNGHFDQLPGQVFGKGFAKNICKVLKTDGEEILKLYDAGFEKFAEANPEDFVQATKMRGSSPKKLKYEIPFDLIYEKFRIFLSLFQNRLVSIGLTVGLILTLSLGIVFLSRTDSPDKMKPSTSSVAEDKVEEKQIVEVEELKQEPEKIEEHQIDKVIVQKTEAEKTIAAEIEQKNDQDDEAGVDSDVKKVAEGKEPQAVADSSNEKLLEAQVESTGEAVEKLSVKNSDEAVQPVAGSELQVLVSENVRLRLKVDGGRTDVFDLKPGSYSYAITKKAELLLFNAAAVEMVFGGRKLGDLGRKGRIRKLVFRVDDQQGY